MLTNSTGTSKGDKVSHFTKLDKANIVSPEAFKLACKELGFDHIVNEGEVESYDGSKVKAVAVAKKAASSRYGVGLVKNATGKYDMLSDWWGVRCYDKPSRLTELGCMSDSDIQNAILRTTTKHTILLNYRRQGFMASVKEDQQHNITVTLQR